MFFFYTNNLNHQNLLVKTEVQKNNLFDLNYKIASDRNLFLDLFVNQNKSFRHCNYALSYYEAESGLSSVSSLCDEETKQIIVGIINIDRENPIKNLKLVIDHADNTFDINENAFYAQEWELTSGNRYAKAVSFENGKPVVEFELEPIGEKMFVFSAEKDACGA